MVRLEHLNLVVQNIEQSLKFYQAAFPHWSKRGGGISDWHGKERNWLHFGDDYNYLTFNDNGTDSNRDLKGHQVGLAHMAFVVSDIQSLIQRLEAAGFKITNPGAEDEYRDNVYFIDPDGFEVEFVEYQSDVPEKRNRYI